MDYTVLLIIISSTSQLKLVRPNPCYASIPTLKAVHSCPQNQKELTIATEKKRCESLAFVQKCTQAREFRYHCVLNSWKNETVEVCAPTRYSQGFCLEFNEVGAKIQELYDEDCTTYSNPCEKRFSSSDVLSYSECSKRIMAKSTTTLIRIVHVNTTNNPPMDIANNSAKSNGILIGVIVTLVVILVGLIVFLLIFIIRSRRKCKTSISLCRKKKRQYCVLNFTFITLLLRLFVYCLIFLLEALMEKKITLGMTKNRAITEYPNRKAKRMKRGELTFAQVPISDDEKAFKKPLISRKAGFDPATFLSTMKKFSIDRFVHRLTENGVDCLETFRSLTKEDFDKIGLNVGQTRTCVLAIKNIDENGLSSFSSGEDTSL